MHEELKAAGSSGYLAALVGGSVGKALRLLAEKAEYMAAAGPELRQVRNGGRCMCLSARQCVLFFGFVSSYMHPYVSLGVASGSSDRCAWCQV